jgi:hypothetical protein
MAKVFHVRAPKTMTLAKMDEASIYKLVEAEATKSLKQMPQAVRPVGVNAVMLSQIGAGGGGGWAEWTRACCGSRALIDEYTDPTPEELAAAGLAARPVVKHIESSFTITTPSNLKMHATDTPDKS